MTGSDGGDNGIGIVLFCISIITSMTIENRAL